MNSLLLMTTRRLKLNSSSSLMICVIVFFFNLNFIAFKRLNNNWQRRKNFAKCWLQKGSKKWVCKICLYNCVCKKICALLPYSQLVCVLLYLCCKSQQTKFASFCNYRFMLKITHFGDSPVKGKYHEFFLAFFFKHRWSPLLTQAKMLCPDFSIKMGYEKFLKSCLLKDCLRYTV